MELLRHSCPTCLVPAGQLCRTWTFERRWYTLFLVQHRTAWIMDDVHPARMQITYLHQHVHYYDSKIFYVPYIGKILRLYCRCGRGKLTTSFPAPKEFGHA